MHEECYGKCEYKIFKVEYQVFKFYSKGHLHATFS
jgi:hypothetical protein